MSQPSHKVQKKQTYGYRFNRLSENLRLGKVSGSEVLESRVLSRSPSMQWQDIRQHYPHQWLLVEAITAHSAAGKRVLEHLAVIDTFPDSVTAMQRSTR